MSPEYIKNNILTFSYDYWSLGCILYEIITFEKAFTGKKLSKLKNNILNIKYNINKKNIYYKNLINGLLNKNYTLRFNKIDIDNFYLTKISSTRRNSLDKKFLPKNRMIYLPLI